MDDQTTPSRSRGSILIPDPVPRSPFPVPLCYPLTAADHTLPLTLPRTDNVHKISNIHNNVAIQQLDSHLLASTTSTRLMASHFLPLLHCPLCLSPLTAPVTLFCGHSVCSKHVSVPAPPPPLPSPPSLPPPPPPPPPFHPF